MKKVFKFLNIVLALIFFIVVISHVFFSSEYLNQVLSTKVLFAHFYAFPILFGLIIAITSILVLIIILLVNRKNKTKVKKSRMFLAWSLIFISSIIYIIFGNDIKQKNMSIENKETFKILAWNTQNSLNAESAEKIFKQYDVDIAILPEFSGYIGEGPSGRIKDIFDLIDLDYEKYTVYKHPNIIYNVAPVTIITKNSFSAFENVERFTMNSFGTVQILPKSQEAPNIIGLHTAPPVPSFMSIWRYDLDLIDEDIVALNPNSIIAGDFNATLRHGKLSKIDSHDDALDYLPFYNRGTWPINLPQIYRTPIDHLLIPKDMYKVNQVKIVDFSVSDHAGIYVELYKND